MGEQGPARGTEWQVAKLIEIGVDEPRRDLDIHARDEAENARRISEDGRAALEAELVAARAEIAAIRAANQTIPDRHDYNEAATRDLYIDMLLREVKWTLILGPGVKLENGRSV
jgi:hypothetical protein